MKKLIEDLFKKNHLYRNSIYLIATNGIASVSGFFFWILVARNYTSTQIGLATSLFSLTNLISSFSLLGFNVGLMRHLPGSNQKNEKISSVMIISASVSALLAIGTLSGLHMFSKPLLFVRENVVYSSLFVLFTIVNTLNLLSESIFVAFRATFHVLIKVILQNIVKLTLLFFLVTLGAFGIYLVLSFSNLIAITYAFVVMIFFYAVTFRPRIDKKAVQKIAYVSFGTYVSGLTSIVPSYILPILITSAVSPSDTAYYYIVAATINILFIIPQVITQNMLVEGSYEQEKIKQHLQKASRLIAAILIPSVLVIIFFGNYILIVFGKQYSTNGHGLMQLLAISAIISGVNYVVGTLLTIYNHIKYLIAINAFGSIMLLISSYIFLKFGIIGVGYATIATQSLLVILYCFSLYRVKKLHLLRFLL